MESRNRNQHPSASDGHPAVFRPAVPTDQESIVRLYAIAARAVCARPESLPNIERYLQAITDALIQPELGAAQACARLWVIFAKVATLPKEGLRVEAGRAFARDLDALGQRLDLPPLPNWEQFPTGIDDAEPVALTPSSLQPEAVALDVVQKRAQEIQQKRPEQPFEASEAAFLLNLLDASQRRNVLDTLVGRGILMRSEVNLLIRYLVKGGELSEKDTTLSDAFSRLGDWLAKNAAPKTLGGQK